MDIAALHRTCRLSLLLSLLLAPVLGAGQTVTTPPAPAAGASAVATAAPASAGSQAGAGRQDPAPPSDPGALAIYQRLAQIRARGGALPRSEVTLAQALDAFYAARGYQPAWTVTDDVQQLLDQLRALDQDGLQPSDYGTQAISESWNALAATGRVTPAQQAQFDLLASSAYITATVQLARGKVDPAGDGPNSNLDPASIDAANGLSWLLQAVAQHQLGQAFAHARSSNPIYGHLRDELARLRQLAASVGWPSIAAGPTLKPGMRDPRVASLRQRLAAEGYLPAPAAGDDLYDDNLKQAMQRFQREHYLDADGNLGAQTLAILNIPVSTRIDQLRVNLERARWLLHELTGTFVIVDIAGYKIAYYRDGKPVWRSRVQVGKPYRSTPIFKSRITYVTFNPTWTVPPTIFKKDIVPKIRQDPGYLAANRIRVLDASGQPIDPRSVDWSHPGNILLRQDAGPGNSLGQVVIRFPNPFSIYLHDTPHRELFDRERRDTSSGCIRVENPLQLVQLLFNDPDRWNSQTIDERLASNRTQNVTLPQPVPILLAYWTVDVGDDGRVTFKPDIYQRDTALLAMLDKPRPLPAL